MLASAKKPAYSKFMKKIIFFLTAAFLLILPAWAHPPTDLKLSYDLTAQTLRMEMVHTTNNMREHHIRRVEISKNGGEPTAITVVKQAAPSSHVEELVFPASPKDTIRVEVFSKEGGTASAEITIPEPFNPDSY